MRAGRWSAPPGSRFHATRPCGEQVAESELRRLAVHQGHAADEEAVFVDAEVVHRVARGEGSGDVFGGRGHLIAVVAVPG